MIVFKLSIDFLEWGKFYGEGKCIKSFLALPKALCCTNSLDPIEPVRACYNYATVEITFALGCVM